MTPQLAAEWLGYLSVGAGTLIFLGAAFGLLRFSDLYMRSSGVATAAGLGVVAVIIGAFLLHPSWESAPKLFIAALAQFASSAVGAMAIARSGYLAGAAPAEVTVFTQVEFERPEADPEQEPQVDDD